MHAYTLGLTHQSVHNTTHRHGCLPLARTHDSQHGRQRGEGQNDGHARVEHEDFAKALHELQVAQGEERGRPRGGEGRRDHGHAHRRDRLPHPPAPQIGVGLDLRALPTPLARVSTL